MAAAHCRPQRGAAIAAPLRLHLLELLLQLQNLVLQGDALLALDQRLGGCGQRQEKRGSEKQETGAH
ncbi:hypothetical protein GT370_01505 [Acidocella sp. MX-AZ03]|uniref:hypothetical protein n=1 Tax=Acidocella sp. MX-AZ03 TaxID=2697363 RepID=UPI0022DD35CC|nr:hypothetical protein [Acidocella sp. MX-AZ03]WBO59634.1 hypothetical protein GT370_01505 [Acidocella sp. MX-AZ03]